MKSLKPWLTRVPPKPNARDYITAINAAVDGLRRMKASGYTFRQAATFLVAEGGESIVSVCRQLELLEQLADIRLDRSDSPEEIKQ